MAAVIRNNFRVFNAKTFVSAFMPNNSIYSNTLYLGIGRPQSWSVNSDAAPPPANNIKDELFDWADLMHMKRVFPSNLSFACPKRLWAPNTKYDIFRHDWNGYTTSPGSNTRKSEVNVNETPTDLSKVNYYATTSSNKIFVCLKNAKQADGVAIAPSLINPEDGSTTVPGTTAQTIEATGIKYCSDGYVWLELGNSVDQVSQFETVDYYPVHTATSDSLGNSALQYALQTSAAAYKGGIYNIKVTTKGSGYNSGAQGWYHITDSATGEVTTGAGVSHVKVLGDGTGLQYVVKYGAGGTLDSIFVTNPGTGYTWADVVVVGANTGSGGSSEAILTPLYGIGTDPVKTLNAYYIIANTTIYDDENIGNDAILHGTDFTVDNDYRKIVLVANPRLTAGGSLSTLSKVDMTYGFTTSSKSGIQADDILTHAVTGARVRVVDVDTSGGGTLIRVIQTYDDKNGTSINVDPTTGIYNKTGGTCTVTSIALPAVVYGSGDVIYADYRRPVMRAKLQSESFSIVLEF